MRAPYDWPPGAMYRGDGRCQFVVWAPRYQRLEVHVLTSPERLISLSRGVRGYHQAIVEGTLLSLQTIFQHCPVALLAGAMDG